VRAGCALVGGETAEHPGVMRPDEYDISGSAVGIVDADRVLGPERVLAGDVLIALGSSGLHSNGYSLVRAVLGDRDLAEPFEDRTLADELLEPTRIYAQDCLALAERCEVHAFAHITGGGLAGNLARVLPAHLQAVVARDSWAPQPVFDLIARAGRVALPDLERTFNLGVGMVAVVPADRADTALHLAAERGVPGWVLGDVRARESGAAVELTGSYQGAAASWRTS
jgi:phosphoribosylformylglycinamidine cyclo-ligase